MPAPRTTTTPAAIDNLARQVAAAIPTLVADVVANTDLDREALEADLRTRATTAVETGTPDGPLTDELIAAAVGTALIEEAPWVARQLLGRATGISAASPSRIRNAVGLLSGLGGRAALVSVLGLRKPAAQAEVAEVVRRAREHR